MFSDEEITKLEVAKSETQADWESGALLVNEEAKL